jgi:hypothetical protein
MRRFLALILYGVVVVVGALIAITVLLPHSQITREVGRTLDEFGRRLVANPESTKLLVFLILLFILLLIVIKTLGGGHGGGRGGGNPPHH